MKKKEIKIIKYIKDNEDSYDNLLLEDEYILSTSELTENHGDATYNREIHSSFDFVKFAKKLFNEAGLNFEEYFDVVVEDYK